MDVGTKFIYYVGEKPINIIPRIKWLIIKRNWFQRTFANIWHSQKNIYLGEHFRTWYLRFKMFYFWSFICYEITFGYYRYESKSWKSCLLSIRSVQNSLSYKNFAIAYFYYIRNTKSSGSNMHCNSILKKIFEYTEWFWLTSYFWDRSHPHLHLGLHLRREIAILPSSGCCQAQSSLMLTCRALGFCRGTCKYWAIHLN